MILLGAPHLDFEMWESTNSMKLLHPVRGLLIRQENSDIVSHPFPQKAREWMGHPDSIPKGKMLCPGPTAPEKALF
jgi:hypothetical protein